MKWSFRIGSVIAAAVLAFGLLLHFNEKAAYALSKVPVLGNIVKIVTFRDFEDNTGEMSASVRVPEVKVTGKDQKADEDASKKLNAQIKKYTDKIIDEYWKDVKETKGKGRENMTIDYSELDSFVIYICMEGTCTVTDGDGNSLELQAGESILFPATTKEVKVTVEGHVKFLETYV